MGFASCGCFGKIPQQPDFVSHQLTEAFTAPFHQWLQTAGAVSREQLGESWLTVFLTSPVWHFALAADVCGPQAVVGTLIPSVDEVGRYFHFVVAHVGNHHPWDAYLGGQEWFGLSATVALRALDDQASYTELIAGVDQLPSPHFPPLCRYGAESEQPWSPRPCAVELPVHELTQREAALGLLARTYERLLGPHSLWWTTGSRLVAPTLLISAGLPQAGQVAAMLDGDWQHWGWAAEMVAGGCLVDVI